jgi:pimeloyl-ACP methyl ester carboxylesterase
MNTTQPIVYLLPGLGLSPEIYSQLELEAEVHYLKWLDPQKKETLASYAARIASEIDTTQGEVILIGHSFGGITMQEISKIVPTKKVIIISSIKSEREKPATLKFWLKVFPVYQLAGKKVILNSFKNWGTAHGYDTPASKEVFRSSVEQLSNYYFKWATQQVCKWKKEGTYPAPIIHIHGTKDKTFPLRKIKNLDYIVQNGSHVMLYNKGQKISTIINSELKK